MQHRVSRDALTVWALQDLLFFQKTFSNSWVKSVNTVAGYKSLRPVRALGGDYAAHPPLQKESAKLAILCGNLVKRFNDAPPQESKHGDIEWRVCRSPSVDVLLTRNNRVEKQLAQWSKWGFIWSWCKFRSPSHPA